MNEQDEKSWAHVLKSLRDSQTASKRSFSCNADISEAPVFCNDPTQYDWKCMGKQKVLVPYDCDSLHFDASKPPIPLNNIRIQWELQSVWIVEGALHRGESNVLAVRRFYLDEDTWSILLGEGYDSSGTMVQYFMQYKSVTPTSNDRGRWYPVNGRSEEARQPP
jgi:hypothetical protein